MRIVYLARHNSGDNNDEDAIHHALVQLGHEVLAVNEKYRRGHLQQMHDYRADFLLFHKTEDIRFLKQVQIPKAFWFFDMVDSKDPTLVPRARSRVNWIEQITPLCVRGFCTDGDWVETNRVRYNNKLVHLMQGADERFVGFGKVEESQSELSLLFTGMIHHGRDRANHIAHLQEKWGEQFHIIGDSGPKGRLHGRDLANLFARTKIVIAPQGPNTHNYWSNRVYLTLGFGGFLLHPYCRKLEDHYRRSELITYHDWQHLDGLIEYYLPKSVERLDLANAGYRATLERNLYRHRCEILIEKMKEVLS